MSVLSVLENTEVALHFIEVTFSLHILMLISVALNADILSDQCDSIELRRGHDFLSILVQIQFYSHS